MEYTNHTVTCYCVLILMFWWLNSSTWSVITIFSIDWDIYTWLFTCTVLWLCTDKFTQFFWSMCREIHSVVHLLKLISCSNKWYLGSVENISQTIADKCSLDIDYMYWLFVGSLFSRFLKKISKYTVTNDICRCLNVLHLFLENLIFLGVDIDCLTSLLLDVL